MGKTKKPEMYKLEGWELEPLEPLKDEDYDVAMLQDENRALNEENDKLVKKQTELQSQLDYVEIMRDFYESKANILEKAIILLYDRRK